MRAATGTRASRLLGWLHLDLARGDHRNSVILAGSGRSGTTWVSGVINHRNAYRLVFEPFNTGKVRIMEGFRRKQYLRPSDRREEHLRPARTVLAGGLRSLWADRFNAKLVARRRLIKDIRANLLIGWMRENFPGMPIVLLLRHPCAVATSKLALGWNDALRETMEQEELVEDFLLPMEAEIRASTDPFERHIFSWCIENHVPLKQLGPGEVHLCFYENFLAHPEHELRRLFAFLGDDPDSAFYESVRRALKSPSPLSRNPEAPSVDAWRRCVTGVQLERAVEILGLFGLDRVYGEGAMPDASAAHALMGGARR